MTDAGISPEINQNIESVTGDDIAAFSEDLLNKISHYSDDKPLNELFDGDSYLANGIMPALSEEFLKTIKNSNRLIPKDPAFRLIKAIFGVSPSEVKLALDGYTGSYDDVNKLCSLSEGDRIQISREDMQIVGRILGKLFANHGLAGRSIKEVKPGLGDLVVERQKLLDTSRDRLSLLDTILEQFSNLSSTK